MKKILFCILILIGLYSLSFAGFGGDSLGNHKAKKNLNMQEHDIDNPSLVDGIDIPSLAVSTGTVPKSVTLVVGFTNDCDYICDGTDDHVQINQAITAIAALSSGTVKLREGRYDIDGDIEVEMSVENVILSGQGTATRFRIKDNNYGINITANSCVIENILFEAGANNDYDGYIQVSGEDYTIRDCHFILPSVAGDTVINTLTTSHRGKILNNKFVITDPDGRAILVQGSSGTISGNYFFNSGDVSIYGVNSWSAMVTENSFMAAEGIELVASAIRWMINGNNFEGCTTEITDAGTGTQIRNNLDANGAWLPETDGDGNKNDEVNLEAEQFSTAGNTNNASIYLHQKEITYDGVTSTGAMFTVKLPDSARPNHAFGSMNWSRQWDDSTVNLFVTFVTSSTSAGNTNLRVGISTCMFVGGEFEVYDSTTGVGNGWCDQRTATMTISSTSILFDGKHIIVHIGRGSEDTSTQTIYVLNTKFAFTKD